MLRVAGACLPACVCISECVCVGDVRVLQSAVYYRRIVSMLSICVCHWRSKQQRRRATATVSSRSARASGSATTATGFAGWRLWHRRGMDVDGGIMQ